MRALVVLVAVALGASWLVIRHWPTPAEADVAHNARPDQVQSIALDGRRLPLAMLRQTITTRPGELVDREKLARDRAALEAALVRDGYLTAQVQPARVTYDDAGAAFIVFSIDQGPQFRVRAVTVTGATQLEAGVVALTAGEVALGDRIVRAREALAQRLTARGKQPVTVEVTLALDRAAGLVDIQLVATR